MDLVWAATIFGSRQGPVFFTEWSRNGRTTFLHDLFELLDPMLEQGRR
jgi:hypothetical protein